MTTDTGIALVERDEKGVDKAFRKDVLTGLGQAPKAIPARWFYDEEGSRLFERITQVGEYYPTRAETEILGSRGGDFAELIGPGRAVVEFGSGSSVKTPLLLEAIDPAAYVPLDISGDFLRESAAALGAKFPGLPVHPVEADFMRRVSLPDAVAALPKLGFFPGSTIGNMVPRTAVDLLRSMRATLGADEGASPLLLIGMDLVKDSGVLESAYDDAEGVTAAFNMNLLTRINRELAGTIPADAFAHEARWNDDLARIEMHLVATRDVAFEVSGERFTMQRGETIHTENSHKFTPRTASLLLLAGGWTPLERWTDAKDQFSVLLARATDQREAP
ncbi:L-histidine N(alpha)-methyltransferase [Qipengyuania flava]|uniref:L-histidine N(alpha)-methyltransferase n=1 Tax=Qipengyuania flava TaxID=192812 RepID=UPI001ADA667F|nr:L-histidine N(alpha)-methyltransferase [Qipengyuania flava]MBO9505529.1 L-histidine N(alpha)-methyltransferase [Qipengyuania flava]